MYLCFNSLQYPNVITSALNIENIVRQNFTLELIELNK